MLRFSSIISILIGFLTFAACKRDSSTNLRGLSSTENGPAEFQGLVIIETSLRVPAKDASCREVREYFKSVVEKMMGPGPNGQPMCYSDEEIAEINQGLEQNPTSVAPGILEINPSSIIFDGTGPSYSYKIPESDFAQRFLKCFDAMNKKPMPSCTELAKVKECFTNSPCPAQALQSPFSDAVTQLASGSFRERDKAFRTLLNQCSNLSSDPNSLNDFILSLELALAAENAKKPKADPEVVQKLETLITECNAMLSLNAPKSSSTTTELNISN